ncbi:hypothetical protein ACFS07_36005 [Undibacterium arcticum]
MKILFFSSSGPFSWCFFTLYDFFTLDSSNDSSTSDKAAAADLEAEKGEEGHGAGEG